MILYSSDRAVEVTMDAMQCLGGNGYINGKLSSAFSQTSNNKIPASEGSDLMLTIHSILIRSIRFNFNSLPLSPNTNRVSRSSNAKRRKTLHSRSRNSRNQKNVDRKRIQQRLPKVICLYEILALLLLGLTCLHYKAFH